MNRQIIKLIDCKYICINLCFLFALSIYPHFNTLCSAPDVDNIDVEAMVDNYSGLLENAALSPTTGGFVSSNQLTFGDPCNCADTQNCEVGGVYYFHDKLRIPAMGTETPYQDIQIMAATGLYITNPCDGPLTPPILMSGNCIFDGTRIVETVYGVSGIYEIDFWRPSGVVPTLTVMSNYICGRQDIVPADTFGSCTIDACRKAIPTLSQWGLLILGIFLLIISIVAIQEKALA